MGEGRKGKQVWEEEKRRRKGEHTEAKIQQSAKLTRNILKLL